MASPKAWKSHYATHQFFPIEVKGNLRDYNSVKEGDFTHFVHHGIVCDGCKEKDIVGVRSKCLICQGASSALQLQP